MGRYNLRLYSKAYAKLWLSIVGRSIPFSDPCASPHRTVEKNGIPLDRKIAPLVEAIWRAGINTSNSCQGDRKLDEKAHRVAPNFYSGCYAATVTFDTVEDAHEVMTALVKAMHICGFREDERRVNLSFGLNHGVFVTFPAKLLTTFGFLTEFKGALPKRA